MIHKKLSDKEFQEKVLRAERMTTEEYFALLKQEDKIHCVGGCGTPIGVDILNHPPDKYNYCHSYCCWCCPDTNKQTCDRDIVERELIAEVIK